VKRVFVAAAFLAAAAGMTASSAGATNECRGLQVCVRVAGPWVVVPAAQTTPRPRVDFQLSCPRGYVIGGLDAELTDRAINVDFLGKLGSPVNPGVTTARSALFRGTYTGNAPKGPSFRPHLGCRHRAAGRGRCRAERLRPTRRESRRRTGCAQCASVPGSCALPCRVPGVSA
jgi:hypothetical protein